MTICVGAVCDNGDKVVVVSDRMVTAEHLSIEFEGQESKIIKLTNSCVAMTAGSALIHDEIFGAAKSEVNSGSITLIPQIIDKLKKAFVNERKKRFEESILKPRNMTLDEFYGGAQRRLDPTISMRLDRELENAKLNLEIIIAGVDQSGGHVYCLLDPGVAQCFNALGFCGIGSGYPHSMYSLIFGNFNPRTTVNKAAYLVYEAKRKSESAPGVGENMDMAIIDKNKIRTLSPAELDQLRSIYETKVKLERPDEIEELIKKLKLEE